MQELNADTPPQKQYEPFWLREKIGEMLTYGYPLTMTFARRDKELADELRRSILTIYRLSVEIDKKYMKKTTTQTLDVELAVLRKMVEMAGNKDLHGKKCPPPLTMHQREVWQRYNDEIGRLLGGYLKSI